MQFWISKITDHAGIKRTRFNAFNFNQAFIDE